MKPTEAKTHFQLFSKVLLAAFCLSALLAAGCSKSSTQNANGTAQANSKPAAQEEARADQKGGSANTSNAPEANEPPRLASTEAAAKYSDSGNAQLQQPAAPQNDATIVGVWRYTTQYHGTQCQGEDVYQPNGQYSSMVECPGWGATQQTGVYYFLQPGVLRRDIKDYSPKVFQGVEVRMIAGETFRVGFLDNNRMVYGDSMVLYRAG
ncbi:MAG TPA: hypothetical protein VF791_22710 [Pyrinomonadaceae bacterium]